MTEHTIPRTHARELTNEAPGKPSFIRAAEHQLKGFQCVEDSKNEGLTGGGWPFWERLRLSEFKSGVLKFLENVA